MRRLFNKKAQSTLEYAILIAVVVGALIGMQIYVKRGIQGRLKESSDQIGSQFQPTETTISQVIDHVAYTSTYDVDSSGTVTQDKSGRGETFTTDTSTTPW